MENIGTLYLLPSLLGDADPELSLPSGLKEIIEKLDCFLVENERSARRFLVKLGLKHKIDASGFYILDKRTSNKDRLEYLDMLIAGISIGILSEAGMPAVADPGERMIMLAHENGITVRPITGPSSILLALAASGFNGQHFSFNGYLPIPSDERKQRIRQLEQVSLRERSTQIFIETPYRNQALVKDILSACSPGTWLCIASNLTTADESISSMTIQDWRQVQPELGKVPAVFLLFAIPFKRTSGKRS